MSEEEVCIHVYVIHIYYTYIHILCTCILYAYLAYHVTDYISSYYVCIVNIPAEVRMGSLPHALLLTTHQYDIQATRATG